MKIVRSVFFYTILLLSTTVLGTFSILGSFVSRWWPVLMAKLWGQVNLWTAGVKVDVEGAQNLDPKGTYVLTSNHQGWFDIFAALGYFPIPFSWLAKEELFKIPILGRAMLNTGYIPINRSDHKQALISMNKAAERIREGTSVFIFPEGTRSPDGVIREFKKGGFVLAAKSQQPIVPISISGSHRILPKKSWLIQPGPIKMKICKPVLAAGADHKSRDLLLYTVREAIRASLSAEEAGTPTQPPPEPTVRASTNGSGLSRNA